MPIEGYLVTALPHSAAPDAAKHLSLFVTHRLTPDNGKGTVSDFPHIVDWTTQVASATITVTGRAGAVVRSIPVTPLLDRLDPALWPRVFAPELTVLPWQTPDPASLPWRTFPAHRMQAHALTVHALSLLSSPVDPPTVAGNVLAQALLRQFVHGDQLTVDMLLGEFGQGMDASITRRLDAAAGVGTAALTSALLDAQGSVPTALLLAADAHLARRYYQRPEEDTPYRAEPDPAFTPSPVIQDPPDFHRRASLLGDLSPLLRKLGLVIDLRVDDLATMAGVTEISADLTIAGLDNQVVAQPRIACTVEGSGFTADSATGDYDRGMLRLGDGESFTILDLDPDASGLKLEQYVRTLPRLLASETNGDATSSAPSTLRGTGFAMARNDRADQLRNRLTGAPGRDGDIMAGKGPALHLEDVGRGVRLEVWDDVSKMWHSLHRRRLSAQIDGTGAVLDAAPDTGFLQGAALSKADGVPNAPLHSHEVLAGWDGWSLSAPRPGLTVVHDGGTEQLVPPPTPAPDPDHPVQSVSNVEAGTLPRLRYGRSYAFRAWAVDLAGNSAPHTVAGPVAAGDGGVSGPPPDTPTAPDDATAAAATAMAADVHAHLVTDATVLPGRAANLGAATIGALRTDLGALRARPVEGPTLAGRAGGTVDLRVTDRPDLDALVSARLPAVAPQPVPRRQLIERTVDDVLPNLASLVERTETAVPATALAAALGTAAHAQPGLSANAIAALLARLQHVVTAPRPFLRWDPVLEPVVVPRHAYSEAESLLTLVVRSGVTGPGPDSVTMTVVPPAEYVPAVLAAHPELDLTWRVDSQRHLVPPKTSQFECELHGLFDAAFGGASADDVKQALAIALREAGTLTDTTVADPVNPGLRIPQPGVQLVTGPTADEPAITDPAELVRGDGLARGQYAIHDVDTVQVPYLPDPLADGVSFVFPDGGQGTELTGLLAVEGTRLPYAGQWPDPVPWRLVLSSGAVLGADARDGVVQLALPPGEQLRMRASSSIRPEQLDLLGLWRSLPAALRTNPVFADAAADGWFWWLTPAATMRLVHAVPRPLRAPRFMLLRPERDENATSVTLFAGVDAHAPSTDRLDIEATWSEWVDDASKPTPTFVEGVTAAVGHTTVDADERIVVFADQDDIAPLPDGTSLRVHAAVHQTGDTKHRMIDYRLRATTRFREYFDPRLLTELDDYSVAGPARTTNVRSSARPAKPAVRDLIPLLRWHQESAEDQPFALSRTRRGGVRIYLGRPWYTTGNGELLAVVLARGRTVAGAEVSQWGADPAFVQDGPDKRGDLPLVDLFHARGLDDRPEAARPVGVEAVDTLVDLPGRPNVTLLGYQPEFSEDRGLWFVDVALDPGPAFWPFVRLTVARYQPNSLDGLTLSPIVKCDFVQVLPQRTALLSRPDDGTARVVITGPVGVPGHLGATDELPFAARVTATRVMHARLERRVPAIGTDLGWETVTATVLPVRGIEGTMVSWEGAITLPPDLAPLPPQRPGSNPDWRVVVEEWEALPADPALTPPAAVAPVQRRGMRVVYADQLPL